MIPLGRSIVTILMAAFLLYWHRRLGQGESRMLQRAMGHGLPGEGKEGKDTGVVEAIAPGLELSSHCPASSYAFGR